MLRPQSGPGDGRTFLCGARPFHNCGSDPERQLARCRRDAPLRLAPRLIKRSTTRKISRFMFFSNKLRSDGTIMASDNYLLRGLIPNKEKPVDTAVDTNSAAGTAAVPGLSWASIAAGAVVTAAVSLALLALGAGLGLSSVSPWADSGVSASTFKTVAGIYLVVVAVMSSAIGGYLAARLRAKWSGIHTNEVFFRDTAHGFVTWAFATVLSAGLLGAAATHLVSGAVSRAAPTATQASTISPLQVFVDRLFRADPAANLSASPGANNDAARAEVLRLLTASFRDGSELSSADRTYVSRLVSAQTGMGQPEAEKRVNDVIDEAKAAADRARNGAAKLSLWMVAALLFGAFAAVLAAAEGGQLRDGTWNGRRLVPRAWE
jgi:hypothetical protein